MADINELKVSNGVVKVGDPVSCDNSEGLVKEGRVFGLMDNGQEWLDKKWKNGTVIVEYASHSIDEDGVKYGHWNPENVTKLN